MLETSTSPSQKDIPLPGLFHGLLCFCGVLLLIIGGLFYLSVSLHSLMFLSILWVGVNARFAGHSASDIQSYMSDAIQRALPAIYIFVLIGIVIASFMHSGTIAALLYYGLDWLNPQFFLPLGLLLCALMSLCTGTSWGTVGTMGVVLIGLGTVMGIPLPLVAGMVISGATFGDKNVATF